MLPSTESSSVPTTPKISPESQNNQINMLGANSVNSLSARQLSMEPQQTPSTPQPHPITITQRVNENLTNRPSNSPIIPKPENTPKTTPVQADYDTLSRPQIYPYKEPFSGSCAYCYNKLHEQIHYNYKNQPKGVEENLCHNCGQVILTAGSDKPVLRQNTQRGVFNAQ